MAIVLRIDGADHGMLHPGDPVRSAETRVEVTRAIVGILGSS